MTQNTSSSPTAWARQRRQRDRALHHERHQEEAGQVRRSGRAYGERLRLAALDAEQRLLYPTLAAAIDANDGFLPRIRTGSASDSAARRQHLERMAEQHGELVMLTWIMRDLDGLPLKGKAFVQAARRSVDGLLAVRARLAPAYDVACQRGGQLGCSHAHIVLPLASVSAALQATARAAPAEAGGGAWAVEGQLHIVRLHNTPADRARVAGYLARDPDGRFDLPHDHADYLAALEDALLRKQTGRPSPRLSWRRSI